MINGQESRRTATSVAMIASAFPAMVTAAAIQTTAMSQVGRAGHQTKASKNK